MTAINVWARCFLSVVFFTVTVSVSMSAVGGPPELSKSVLVTGASSGIGKRTTEYLTSKGFFVYAGARKQRDMDALNTMKNVEAVRLDVTIQDDIDNAVRKISGGRYPLMGVVNNAGVAVLGALVELEESELDFLFDVNVYGPYRVTKAFAPLLIKNKGRVVNISSISGILSGPFFGAYSMSKHALEAYTDSLAVELAGFDVKVVAVEPGNYSSKIGASVLQRSQELGQTMEGSLYEKQLTETVGRVGDRDDMADPIAVAKAIEHALSADQPKARYLVVPNQDEAQWTIGKAIQELVQLNQDQPYSYDRDTLVKMLDEALAM